MDKTQIYEKVQERYGSVAKGDDAVYGHKVATAFGYSKEELESIPRDANLGLSCGNPLALAKLKEVCPPCFLLFGLCHATPK
jgi:hypothetical protein